MEVTPEKLRKAFLTTMRAACVDGHFQYLPSEVARFVGHTYGVPPEDVLLAFANSPQD